MNQTNTKTLFSKTKKKDAKWQRKHMERFHLSPSHFSVVTQSRQSKKGKNNAMCMQGLHFGVNPTSCRVWQQPRSCCSFSPVDESLLAALFHRAGCLLFLPFYFIYALRVDFACIPAICCCD
jgi:hypothetical protein